MAGSSSTSGGNDKSLTAYRQQQEEMLRLMEDYSQAREAVWSRELQDLEHNWDAFQRNWQGSLEQMSAQADAQFQEIASQGQAMGAALVESWQTSLAALTEAVDSWATHALEAFSQVGSSAQGMFGGGGWSSWLGLGFDIGGIFHQGGLVEAHRGMVVAPETLLDDEQMVVVQSGEGILPRESMVRLGEENFEAIRSGRFTMGQGQGAPRYDISINVQSLDPAAAAGLDWGRVVQRHLMPALQRELGRSW